MQGAFLQALLQPLQHAQRVLAGTRNQLALSAALAALLLPPPLLLMLPLLLRCGPPWTPSPVCRCLVLLLDIGTTDH